MKRADRLKEILMTYSPLVAAQTDAKEYLAKQASLWGGDLMISGHSKGGNLAAGYSEEDVQLLSIFSRFDLG